MMVACRFIMLAAVAATLAHAPPLRAAEPLGQTLAGETCGWGEAQAASPAGGAKTTPILCGDGAAPAGSLTVVPLAQRLAQDPAARTDAIIAAARSAGDAAPTNCGAAEPLGEDGGSVIIFCTAASTGWPRIVLIAAANGSVYRAEGLPAMLPVLQAAVMERSGRTPSPHEAEAAIRLVEARYPTALARAGGGDAASYKALAELGRFDGAARDYAGAEAADRRAFEIETSLFGATGIAAGETLAELALAVSNQGRFDEAQGLFLRAEPIIDAAPDMGLRARLASYRALDAANQRHYADAFKFAHAATQMRRALRDKLSPGNSGDDIGAAGIRGELAHSLRIEAMMALRLGDLATALADATEVLRIINDEPSLPLWWRPDAVTMMAEIDERREQAVQAERQFREAVAMDRKLFGDTAPTALAELRLGQFYVDQQVYAGAADAFHRALAILAKDEVARAAIGPDQMVPLLTASAALGAKQPERRASLAADAFLATQLIDSDVAGRTIAHAAVRLAADTPALADLLHQAQEAQRRRDALRIELAAETAKPDAHRNFAHEKELAASERTAAASADELARRVAKAFPDYAHFADPGPVDLATLARSLGPGEAFLTVVVGTRSGWTLLITQDGLTMAPLAATQASLAADVGALRSAFVPRLGKVGEFDLAGAYGLYRKLLFPLEAKLKAVDHLIVASGGALASLPFALLVTAPPAEPQRHDYQTAQFLVRRMAVSEVPSPRALLTLRDAAAHHAPAPLPLLAIANPAFGGAAAKPGDESALEALAGRCRENGPIAAGLLRALAPLPETADEVRTVDRLLGGGRLLLGADATERNLRAEPLERYRVIYFATHGLLPGELHCQAEPALVLSPPATPARSTDQDGLLEASEIAGFRLNADLVVLSACDTAAGGGRFGGEALAGLSDAFFNAGARAVLASHWEVPSLATAKLMTGMFGALARGDGQGVAQAIRAAQLQLIAQPQTAHPFYWAAFTVIGDGAAAARTAAVPPAAEPARGRT